MEEAHSQGPLLSKDPPQGLTVQGARAVLQDPWGHHRAMRELENTVDALIREVHAGTKTVYLITYYIICVYVITYDCMSFLWVLGHCMHFLRPQNEEP